MAIVSVSVPFGDYLFLNFGGIIFVGDEDDVSVPFGDYLFLNGQEIRVDGFFFTFPSPSGTIYSSIRSARFIC